MTRKVFNINNVTFELNIPGDFFAALENEHKNSTVSLRSLNSNQIVSWISSKDYFSNYFYSNRQKLFSFPRSSNDTKVSDFFISNQRSSIALSLQVDKISLYNEEGNLITLSNNTSNFHLTENLHQGIYILELTKGPKTQKELLVKKI